MGEVGGRGWKFFDTRPCAKDEYFRAHQEKDIGSHLYIDPRRFYEVFLVSDLKAEWMTELAYALATVRLRSDPSFFYHGWYEFVVLCLCFAPKC